MADQQLTDNFWLSEFTKSATASKKGIKNTPTPEALQAIIFMCVYVLEPLRKAINGPIKIESGYRSKALNEAVGGVPGSQHQSGEACDISAPGWTHEQLARKIAELKLPVDQAIVEYDQGVLHVSVKAPRNQFLTRSLSAGKLVYKVFDTSAAKSMKRSAIAKRSKAKPSKKSAKRRSSKVMKGKA